MSGASSAPAIVILTDDDRVAHQHALTATDMLRRHLQRQSDHATGRELFDINVRIEALRREGEALSGEIAHG